MADKPEAGEETQLDTQVAPESVAAQPTDLDDELGHRLLTGHPADTGGEGEGEAGPGEGEAEAGEGEGGGKGEAQSGKETKPPEWKPKYKNQEEAEKAHAEAERKMHEATTRASELETETKNLKERLEALEKPPEKPAEEVKTLTDDERKAKLREVAKVAHKKAAAAIKLLDDTDPEYEDQWAEAWATANVEALFEAGIGASTLSREELDKIVDQKLAARDKASTEAKAKEEAKTAAEKAWDKALDQAEKAGLAVRDEETADSMVFAQLESKIPKELYGKPKEATEWLIAETQKRLGRTAQTAQEREAAARKKQIDNSVLGLGGRRTPQKPAKAAPGSLDDDFDTVRRERTL
jgi:hypothetical protein